MILSQSLWRPSNQYCGIARAILSRFTNTLQTPTNGRPPAEVYLQRFSERKARVFLAAGSREYGMKLPEEVLDREVESKLDGTPG